MKREVRTICIQPDDIQVGIHGDREQIVLFHIFQPGRQWRNPRGGFALLTQPHLTDTQQRAGVHQFSFKCIL